MAAAWTEWTTSNQEDKPAPSLPSPARGGGKGGGSARQPQHGDQPVGARLVACRGCAVDTLGIPGDQPHRCLGRVVVGHFLKRPGVYCMWDGSALSKRRNDMGHPQ